ncbi:MAG: Gfo/Idh/MocA family protein [Halanaerobiales bacterium]
MIDKISILLVGIGGYGENYIRELLLKNNTRDDYRVVGAVDPYPERCSLIDILRSNNVSVYPSMEDFFKQNSADYAIISSPIQWHVKQTCMALEQGAGVLCEKPLSPTVQEGKRMIEAREEAGKPVGIGYQWSYSKAIQKLKKDIMKGVLGKPVRLKTLVNWPRDFAYYNRNSWAGRIKDDRGNWVLDSVANNATAHYLHNMLYILGDSINSSSDVKSLSAELYRANNIENYDTAAARIKTADDVELLYLVTHATYETTNPRFCYQFENAVVYFDNDRENNIVAEFDDGSKKEYGDPFKDKFRKTWVILDVIKGNVRNPCGPEAALPHVICINGMQEVAQVIDFPDELIKKKRHENGLEIANYVQGLEQVMLECYRNWQLPHEAGVEWAVPGKEIDLKNYSHFDIMFFR